MHPTVILAAGWISTGTGVGNDLKSLIFNVGIPVLCGLFVLVVGWKTKAPGPTIMACIMAAIVWGLSANMSLLKDKTTQDITQYNGPASVQQGDR
ncbi:hypothetical protein [Kitasatospora sp. GP82]|uniref:hypothetical protein n=1 Tax=Kitasatospora sp. GP82 TaxID=3035089 RepID=UPI002473F64E|nr:hypothetical protein [Kitasatospora sp. GP82]MDH6129797.1 hypothetical protein [Kitasatospora sp. GP82]